MSLLPQDVDMSDPFAQETVHKAYITVDTNVFIDHLGLIKELYAKLYNTECRLLVPTIVINELDKLASSDRYEESKGHGRRMVSALARSATTWLLDITRHSRRDTRRITESSLRCQKLVERGDLESSKPDDLVLDCCLYFRLEAHVMLWTSDRNLALLAETNDVPTFGGKVLTFERAAVAIRSALHSMFAHVFPVGSAPGPTPASLVANGHAGVEEDSDAEDEDRMDIDIDSYLIEHPADLTVGSTLRQLGLSSSSSSPTKRQPDHLPPPSYPQTVDSYDCLLAQAFPHQRTSNGMSSTSSSSSSPMLNSSPSTNIPSMSPSRYPTRYSTRLSTTLSTKLVATFRPILLSVPDFAHDDTGQISHGNGNVTSEDYTTCNDPATILHALLDRLTKIETTTPPATPEDHQTFLRCISAIRTVHTYVAHASGARRPRTGEVSDALALLGDNFDLFIVLEPASKEGLRELAREFKIIAQ